MEPASPTMSRRGRVERPPALPSTRHSRPVGLDSPPPARIGFRLAELDELLLHDGPGLCDEGLIGREALFGAAQGDAHGPVFIEGAASQQPGEVIEFGRERVPLPVVCHAVGQTESDPCCEAVVVPVGTLPPDALELGTRFRKTVVCAAQKGDVEGGIEVTEEPQVRYRTSACRYACSAATRSSWACSSLARVW